MDALRLLMKACSLGLGFRVPLKQKSFLGFPVLFGMEIFLDNLSRLVIRPQHCWECLVCNLQDMFKLESIKAEPSQDTLLMEDILHHSKYPIS